jgi:hypothetical protein
LGKDQGTELSSVSVVSHAQFNFFCPWVTKTNYHFSLSLTKLTQELQITIVIHSVAQEPKGSSPHTQQLATGTYPEPV